MEKVEKELAFWQQKMQDTVGKVMNDETISSLQRIIFLFMGEADNINGTLEEQKAHYQLLKTLHASLRQERKQLRKDIKVEMFNNKDTQIVCSKIEARN